MVQGTIFLLLGIYMKVPKLLDLLIIGDDLYLIAQLLTVLSQKGYYTPVIDSPRLTRHDKDGEIIRRNNIAAKYQPGRIILAAVSDEVKRSFQDYFPPEKIDYLLDINALKSTESSPDKWPSSQLLWGRKDIGLGVLKALREKKQIIFDDKVIPRAPINPEFEHLVVCEDGNELSQIMAANYAFAVGAGLCLIPQVGEEEAKDICEIFYSSSEPGAVGQIDRLKELKKRLRSISADIPLNGKRLITFVTDKIPWGFAYPEVPTTHIFRYPDMGISILNALISEQPNTPGIVFGLLIDPSQVQSDDIKIAGESLSSRGIIIKLIKGERATVYNVTRAVNLLPYDFLVISTHCGDVAGVRWTYEFRDSEGRNRTLVVDLALSMSRVPNSEDMIEVMELSRFVSLDGVDWNDAQAKKELYVGTAIHDYLRKRKNNNFIPVKKEDIPRVVGSAALAMSDHHYIPTPESIGGDGSPIILNNACASWHQLAGNFMFANARAYIGTLFPIMDIEAQEITQRLADKYFGKPLAWALWRSQNEMYEDNIKRPYVMVGPHFQSLRTFRADKGLIIFNRLKRNYVRLRQGLGEGGMSDYVSKKTKEYIAYLKEEMEIVYNTFFKTRPK